MNGLDFCKKWFAGFKKWAPKQKGSLLFCIGIVGMGFILLSSVIQTGAKENPSVGADDRGAQSYAREMEAQLTDLIGSIEGVGRCKVMVTTETGVEYVYAVEESRNINETNSFNGEQVQRQTQQQNTDQKYIMVDAGGGKKEALLKTERRPEIQGVVIVCEGASSSIVQQRVTEVVTTALNIPYTKVCVEKIGK